MCQRDGQDVAFTSLWPGMLRRSRGGRGWHRVRASGQELAGDNVGIPTLNVDHPCVPQVDNGKLRTDLFVTACSWRNSPSQTWVTKNPPSRRENVVGRPGTKDRALAVRGPGAVARIRSRTWSSGNMVRWGRTDTCVKRTKNFEALGGFITKRVRRGPAKQGAKKG